MVSVERIRMRPVMGIAMTIMAASLALSACGGSDPSGGGADVDWARVSAQELDAMMGAGEVELINVHLPYEGEIPGTDALIPYTEIDGISRRIAEADADVVLYCRSGTMSSQTAQALVDRGVTDFSELEGGYQAWQDAGLPFEIT
jgi:rhodanese-related sulfurtransferase